MRNKTEIDLETNLFKFQNISSILLFVVDTELNNIERADGPAQASILKLPLFAMSIWKLVIFGY